MMIVCLPISTIMQSCKSGEDWLLTTTSMLTVARLEMAVAFAPQPNNSNHFKRNPCGTLQCKTCFKLSHFPEQIRIVLFPPVWKHEGHAPVDRVSSAHPSLCFVVFVFGSWQVDWVWLRQEGWFRSYQEMEREVNMPKILHPSLLEAFHLMCI